MLTTTETSEDGFWLDGDDMLSQYELTSKVYISFTLVVVCNTLIISSLGHLTSAH